MTATAVNKFVITDLDVHSGVSRPSTCIGVNSNPADTTSILFSANSARDRKYNLDIPPSSEMQELPSKQQQQQANGTSLISDGTNLPSLNVKQERPSHYTYLKEFRVEACPLFKQHQCTNHRPYSCFYWHFANQRRRRPLRKKDGTFNYSADVYCTKYDENTGVCPDGDDCPYLHRVYGDVERKYHLRYYKTALCVHPTDVKGHCTKNGLHCAFAHGTDDVRNPIFDIRELQSCGDLNGESIDNRDRLNFVVEDPVWQDQGYVLINYKTEPCKKPPRLCRQGYACPYYHGSKDKRRPPNGPPATTATVQNGNTNNTNGSGTPANVKYRSTPCPNVKHSDEWGDPELCEVGDGCPYCHTRTEQQFHPEIYKSTKCNDMLQHGYCPRGPFCAFAHTDSELHGERRSSLSSSKRSSVSGGTAASFANIVANQVKQTRSTDDSVTSPTSTAAPANVRNRRMSAVDEFVAPTLVVVPKNTEQTNTVPAGNLETMVNAAENGNGGVLSYSSVLKQRQASGTQSSSPSTKMPTTAGTGIGLTATGMTCDNNYSKAPGYEREQQSPTRPWPSTNPPVSGTDPVDYSGTCDEVSRIKSSLYLHHDIGCDVGITAITGLGPGAVDTPPTPGSMRSNSFSPFGNNCGGMSVWQQQQNHRETVESVVGSIVEDINLEELVLPPISERDERGESLPSSLSQYTNSPGLYGSSAPVTIPGSNMSSNFLTLAASQQYGMNSASFSSPQSQCSNSYAGGVLPSSGGDHQIFRLSGSFGQSTYHDGNNAPRPFRSGSVSGSTHGLNGNVLVTELQRTTEELALTRNKLVDYEEKAKQARQAAQAWRREADEQRRRAQLAEQERMKAEQERDGTATQLALLTNELKNLQLSGLWPPNTDFMTQSQLEQVHSRLRGELDRVERQLQQRATGPMCARCGRHVNGSAVPGSCPVCSPNSKSSGHYAVAT